MHHAVVLHTGGRPHHDAVVRIVPTENGAEPDAGFLLDRHIPNQNRVGGDERRVGDSWSLTVEGKKYRQEKESVRLGRLLSAWES